MSDAIDLAIREDIANEYDYSTLSCIKEGAVSCADLKIKEQGVISGIGVARRIFSRIDSSIIFTQYLFDGVTVSSGDIAFTVEGDSRAILRAERIVLNLMQRMSGIATTTAEYVNMIRDTQTQILDTRKTAPCLRYFDKEAVKHGGGQNHRFGLFDMIMLKDNHIDFVGSIEKAIKLTHDYMHKNNIDLEIEIEVRNLKEVEAVLATGGVDRILLDNFDIDTTRRAVEMIDRQCLTESSGGITLDTVRDYALCGVDYISVGALTHNVKGMDISLKAV